MLVNTVFQINCFSKREQLIIDILLEEKMVNGNVVVKGINIERHVPILKNVKKRLTNNIMKELNNNNNFDYWKVLENVDKLQLLLNLKNMHIEDPELKQLSEWIKDKQEGILKSYIKGIEELRSMAFNLSLHDFGLFLYIAMKYKGGTGSSTKLELKPQSMQLQKELEDRFSQDNIENAIKELGVLTKDELDDNSSSKEKE